MRTWGKVWAVCFLFAVVAGAAWAQVPGEGWERIGLTYTGNITAVAVSPNYETDGTVFIGVRGSGLWASTDRGVTWVQRPVAPVTSTVAGIALARNYKWGLSRTLFAVTAEGHCYRSDNDGATVLAGYDATFTGPVGGGVGCSSVVMTGISSWDGRVYVGTLGGGVWQSLSGGGSSTWQLTSGTQFTDVRALSVSGPSTQFLYAAVYTANSALVYRYLWNLEWGAVGSTGFTGEEPTALHAAWNDPTSLWVGTKTKGMWKCTNPATSPSWAAACDGVVGATATYQVGAIAACPNLPSDSGLWEGRSDGLRVSTDAGASCTGAQPLASVTSIAFSPGYHTGGTYCHAYVGTQVGLYLLTCSSLPKATGPVTIDGQAVALGHSAKGAYLGSASKGLFKCAENLSSGGGTMVQFNAFPNGQVPDIRAICLTPAYTENGTCGTDEAMLFVAANFSSSPADNGVYQSSNFGNSWTKVATGWPTQTPYPVVLDLAISPVYTSDGSDRTLYAATSKGLYRYSYVTGSGWTWTWALAEVVVERVAVPPTYNITGSAGHPYHSVFISRGATGAFVSTTDGSGNWTRLGGTSGPINVTGFAFPSNFFLAGGGTPSSRVYLSSSTAGVLTDIFSNSSGGWNAWTTRNTGLPASLNVLDIAADPDYVEGTVQYQPRLLCAIGTGSSSTTADNGVYFTGNSGTNWAIRQQGRALSLAWELPSSGEDVNVLAGMQNYSQYISPTSTLYYSGGAFFSHTSTPAFDWLDGYRSLPDDVWITRPYARDNNYLFATSPTYGVFLSRDKGDTFRPYNGSDCTPLLYGAYGFANGFTRWAASPTSWNIDTLYAGTACDGIWYRPILGDYAGTVYYTSNMDTYQWSHCTLDGTTFPGPVQKIENLTNGNAYEAIWASSSTKSGCPYSGAGQLVSPAGAVTNFVSNNSGMPSLEATSVRFGGSASLSDGVSVNGSVSQADWNYYTFYVPAGAAHLNVTLNGMDNDADLYVRFTGRPSQLLYDYRPYLGGTTPEIVDVYPASTPVPLTPGVWHVGVRGYAAGVTNYTLTASLLSSIVGSPEPAVAAVPKTGGPAPASLVPDKPTAPASGSLWGTVSNTGVFHGLGSPGLTGAGTLAISWSPRNGQAPTALDTSSYPTQVVAQLSDGTLLAGQGGAIWQSPAPDEGQSTWWDFSSRLSGTSLDIRDFLECANGDLLAAVNGTAGQGGVWLSGSQGRYWMNLSSGFDATRQHLETLVSSNPISGDVRYYTGTDSTGAYTRTITPQNYPTVTSVNPATGAASGGTPVTLTGTGFSAACPTGVAADCQLTSPVVLFDETPVTGTWVSATEISANTPPHGTGTARVRVVNPDSRMGMWASTFAFTGNDPYDLRVTRPGGSVIRLNWGVSATVTVQRARDPQFTLGRVTDVVTDSIWDDTSAAVNDTTTYYYRIQ